MADSMIKFFEQVQFVKGLAIVDYVKAKRQFKKFRKIKEFKSLLKQSCIKFKDLYEVDGISQCVKVAQNWLKSDDKLKKLNKADDKAFIAEL